MVQVYVTRLEEEMGEETFAQLAETVSDKRRQKAFRFKHRADQVRSLAAGVLLRYGMEQCCPERRPWTEENICSDSHGKPYVDGISFNLSHAGIYVAAAFGREDLGIDVEGGRETSERIVVRCHKEEQEWFAREGKEMFYLLWTAKESVMKRDGRGLAMGLDSFSVFSEELRDEIYSKPLDEEYWLSLCTSEEWNGEIHWIEIKDLLEKTGKIYTI